MKSLTKGSNFLLNFLKEERNFFTFLITEVKHNQEL